MAIELSEHNQKAYKEDIYDFVFNCNYQAAVKYHQQHGDLECKCNYVDSDGIKLGAWLNYLRQHYKKRGCALLTEEQFRLLDDLGMRWENKHDHQWNEYFKLLKEYISRTGSTDVPATWRESGVLLGRWFRYQKEQFMSSELRQDRVEKLCSLGVSLVIEDPWETKFQLAKAYSEAHGGDLSIPYDLVVDGVWLNKWVNEQRLIGEGKRKKKLTDEQRRKLESIGMVFGITSNDKAWDAHFKAIKQYVQRSGSIAIPKDLEDKDGVNLKIWINRQLSYARQGRLSEEKTEKLKSIGF